MPVNSAVSEERVREEKHVISVLCSSGSNTNPGFFCPIYRELNSSSNSMQLVQMYERQGGWDSPPYLFFIRKKQAQSALLCMQAHL